MEKKREFFARSEDGRTIYTTDGRFIYAERDGNLHRLDIFEGHYYKLRPWNGVPILEIDGLRMQLVRDFRSPLDYARKVVDCLKLRPAGQGAILDTCMGLGYTAIEASGRPGVARVVTCEISDAVLTLAKWNPFSQGLFEEGGKITIERGSISDIIGRMPDSSFDHIIHDPPRISHAPELYSLGFYHQLMRVCKSGANIFHYCGSVGKAKGRDLAKEASQRLSEAGFKRLRHSPLLQGLIAHVP